MKSHSQKLRQTNQYEVDEDKFIKTVLNENVPHSEPRRLPFPLSHVLKKYSHYLEYYTFKKDNVPVQEHNASLRESHHTDTATQLLYNSYAVNCPGSQALKSHKTNFWLR